MRLLTASLVFYALGEPRFAFIMMGSIAANFGSGLWLDRVREIAERLLVAPSALLKATSEGI